MKRTKALSLVSGALVLTVSLLLAACGELGSGGVGDNGAGGAGNDRSGEYDGTWELVSGRSAEGDIPLDDRRRITLVIEGTRFAGWSACNQYFAEPVTIDGTTIEIDGVGGTEMGCVDRRAMKAETNYYTALIDGTTIERSDDHLTLAGPGVELIYELAPEPEVASLVDTDWKLETILMGDGPDGVASSPLAPASLRLDSDGTFTAMTGCRAYTGEWIQAGDEIAFPRDGVEEDCSEGLKEQDGYFLAMAPFRFTIESQSLTVFPRHGEVDLVFRAS